MISTCRGVDRDKWRNIQELHLLDQNAERAAYDIRIQEACESGGEILSCVIDLIATISLPIERRKSKGLQSLKGQIKVHIIGIVFHATNEMKLIAWMDYFPYGNCILSALYYCLKGKCTEKTTRPSKLYLQMDNCSSQNKNQYMMGFLGELVKKNWFKEVQASFLLVGHTHTDIDRIFSIITNRLNDENVFTIPQLLKTCENAFENDTLKVSAMMLGECYNFQSHFHGHIKPIKDIVIPHGFLLTSHYKEAERKSVVGIQGRSRTSKTDQWGDKYALFSSERDDYIPVLEPVFEESFFTQIRMLVSLGQDQLVFYKALSWWNHLLDNPKRMLCLTQAPEDLSDPWNTTGWGTMVIKGHSPVTSVRTLHLHEFGTDEVLRANQPKAHDTPTPDSFVVLNDSSVAQMISVVEAMPEYYIICPLRKTQRGRRLYYSLCEVNRENMLCIHKKEVVHWEKEALTKQGLLSSRFKKNLDNKAVDASAPTTVRYWTLSEFHALIEEKCKN